VATAQNNLLGEALWAGTALHGDFRCLLNGENALSTQEDYRNWGFERMVSGHKVRWQARQIPGLSGRKAVQESLPVMEKREMGPDSVSAIGFGAMRFAGANLFGPPANRDKAIALPQATFQLSSDHIDMSQHYGLVLVSDPLRDPVHLYPPGMLLGSKVGFKRGKRVPGTSSLRHRRQNLAPTSVRLDSRSFQLISLL
jgi:hypothetical protein